MARTLLLADDSVTIQKVVKISFANEDLEVVTVDNGDDAIETARSLRPDVILADVVMPGQSGYEVCAAIRNDPDLVEIPVLLLAGRSVWKATGPVPGTGGTRLPVWVGGGLPA